MSERHFAWDEISEGLMLVGITRPEDEQIKGRKKQAVTVHASEIPCPHAYLILSYQETLTDREKINFRKYYLRKTTPSESDVIILQDIKDLVLFLLVTPVSPQFINFLHLPIVDRFLRASIIYFQCYVEIWEDLMQERAATMKKAPNPLARGHRSRYAEEMRILSCILGREYADLILGCQSGPQYHHMMTAKKRSSTITQSQGEKDLRIFEVLTSVAHRIVWIALERKHYGLIEVELHRLLRTDAYNTAQRQSSSQIIHDMLEDDIRILHGPKTTLKTKLLRNSPLLHELMYTDCDYRVLSLGITDFDMQDSQIIFLKNALLAAEETLSKLGIKVGILGQNRSDYDIMLLPNEEEQTTDKTEIGIPGEIIKKGKCILLDRSPEQIQDKEETRRDYPHELPEEFPVKEVKISNEKSDKIRTESRRKWILREIKRRYQKPLDTYSVATTLE